jgi:5'-3' exoribonuclease 2
MVRPRKILYLAIDGVAPRAKMNQQRSRRFRAAQDAKEKKELAEELQKEEGVAVEVKEGFDSNCITPGTPFMFNLTVALKYYVTQKLNTDPGWKNVKVIFSDSSVPSEGEHKVMEFIRKQRTDPNHDPNTKHIIYGLDADLIMLALATHEPYFKILREDVFYSERLKRLTCSLCKKAGHEAADCPDSNRNDGKKPLLALKPFVFLHVNVLREYLENELRINSAILEFDLERAIDDWVFMCFFVGNDFLPHLPSLEIREGAIDMLIGIYKKNFDSMGGYITTDGFVDLYKVSVIMEEVGCVEDEIFRKRKEREDRFKQRRKEEEDATIPPKKMRLEDDGLDNVRRLAATVGGFEAKPKSPVKTVTSLLKGNPLEIVNPKEKVDKNAQNKLKAEELRKALKGTKKEKNDDKIEAKDEASEKQDEKIETPTSPVSPSLSAKKRKRSDDGVDAIVSPKISVSPELIEEIEEKILEDLDLEVLDKDAKTDIPDLPIPVAEIIPEVIDEIQFHNPGSKERYYRSKFHVEASDKEFVNKVVLSYVEGLCWVMRYYYQGCPSWDWYYPYHYSPFASDFSDIAEWKIEFKLGEPFRPLEQLMAVLPAGR